MSKRWMKKIATCFMIGALAVGTIACSPLRMIAEDRETETTDRSGIGRDRTNGDSIVEQETNEKILPDFSEGERVTVKEISIKNGKTTPPKRHTEDTVLSAMETAGKEDMPEDAERKGLGTPATRAGILEKLVSAGFVERKKSKKTVIEAVSLDPLCSAVLSLQEIKDMCNELFEVNREYLGDYK